MPEVTVPGEDHRHTGGIRSSDNLFIPHRSAGLDARGSAGINGGLQAVGKWKHRIRGDDGSLQ
jgi:hypothetical protein